MITPKFLGTVLRRKAQALSKAVNVSDITLATSEAEFFVYDDDGGVLFVSVRQYKDPIR